MPPKKANQGAKSSKVAPDVNNESSQPATASDHLVLEVLPGTRKDLDGQLLAVSRKLASSGAQVGRTKASPVWIKEASVSGMSIKELPRAVRACPMLLSNAGHVHSRPFSSPSFVQVSERHARFTWSGEEKSWMLQDLGSSNGTEINGEPIEEGERDGSQQDIVGISAASISCILSLLSVGPSRFPQAIPLPPCTPSPVQKRGTP